MKVRRLRSGIFYIVKPIVKTAYRPPPEKLFKIFIVPVKIKSVCMHCKKCNCTRFKDQIYFCHPVTDTANPYRQLFIPRITLELRVVLLPACQTAYLFPACNTSYPLVSIFAAYFVSLAESNSIFDSSSFSFPQTLHNHEELYCQALFSQYPPLHHLQICPHGQRLLSPSHASTITRTIPVFLAMCKEQAAFCPMKKQILPQFFRLISLYPPLIKAELRIYPKFVSDFGELQQIS